MGKDKEKTPKVSAKMADLMAENARLKAENESYQSDIRYFKGKYIDIGTQQFVSWVAFAIAIGIFHTFWVDY